MKTNIIDKIKKNGLCSGCGLCASISSSGCIHMEYNQMGFLRPNATEEVRQSDQKIIQDICPGINVVQDIKNNYHPIWGPIQKVRVGYSSDPDIRYLGSSGGVITAILDYLLSKNKVDYVIQVKSSTDRKIDNIAVLSRTRKDVLDTAGSRYGPSSPLSRINEFIERPGTFALVGKPCDIVGMRNYAKLNNIVDQKIKYMISFMCAGVPSIYGTNEILEQFNISVDDLASFTYRGKGWPGMTTALTADGKKYEMPYSESWGKILNKYLQFRCKICPDGTGELADLVCADAWYGNEGYPDFSEREGRSLIISRAMKGEELLQECIKNSIIVSEEIKIQEISKMQPYQEERKKLIFSRISALRFVFKEIPRYRGLSLFKVATKVSLFKNFKSFFGMIRRIILSSKKIG